MNDESLDRSIRKFLKHFGVTAQQRIEEAVWRAVADGTLRGDESIPVRATLVIERLGAEHRVDATIDLE